MWCDTSLLQIPIHVLTASCFNAYPQFVVKRQLIEINNECYNKVYSYFSIHYAIILVVYFIVFNMKTAQTKFTTVDTTLEQRVGLALIWLVGLYRNKLELYVCLCVCVCVYVCVFVCVCLYVCVCV
jgi:hypothetical protein